VEYHTSPITTVLTTTTSTETTTTGTTTTEVTTTTTSVETTTTKTTTTNVTKTVVGPLPNGGRISGAGAPMPGPAAPIVGQPLGGSVWQLSQYIPALVPHLGYFLAGR